MNTKQFSAKLLFKTGVFLTVFLTVTGCGPGQFLGPFQVQTRPGLIAVYQGMDAIGVMGLDSGRRKVVGSPAQGLPLNPGLLAGNRPAVPRHQG